MRSAFAQEAGRWLGLLILALTVLSAFPTPAAAQSPPVVTSVEPGFGAYDPQGTLYIGIRGTGLSDVTAVTFGGVSSDAMAPFVVIDDRLIYAILAPGAGAVDVLVTTPHGTSTPNANARFTYQEPPVITSVVLDESISTAYIYGRNLFVSHHQTAVSFGDAHAADVFPDSSGTGTAITATWWRWAGDPSTVTVLTAAGSASFSVPRGPLPSITAVSPASGPLEGGTSVTLTGTGFVTSVTSVTIGETTIPWSGVTVNSPTSLTFTAPAHAAGNAAVTVTTPRGTSDAAPGGFSYQAPAIAPVVTALEPNRGSPSEMTPLYVIIRGPGLERATGVTFGGVSSSVVIWSEYGQFLMASAPEGAGVVDVLVETPEGTSTPSAASKFTYYGPPEITSVTVVPSSMGVRIHGRNLFNIMAVTFANGDAFDFSRNTGPEPDGTTAWASWSAIGSPGNPVGVSVLTSAGIAYGSGPFPTTPSVTALTPTSGPVAGGTSVTVTGADFVPGSTSVTIGGVEVPAASVMVNSPASLTFTAPAHAAGNVAVTVTTPGGTSGAVAGGFTYTASQAPEVISVTLPANGTYSSGALDFIVNFNGAVTATGTPQLQLNVGGAMRNANLVDLSGPSSLRFSYGIQAGDLDTDGITLGGMIHLNGGSLRDTDTNSLDANLSLGNFASTAGILVDAVAPTVVSTQIRGTPPAGATSAVFDVTFSEPVTGLTSADFALTPTGSAAGAVGMVSGSGATYTVTVQNVSGNGTLRLDVATAGTVIRDLADNPLAGPFSNGSPWAVVPASLSLLPAAGPLTGGAVGTAYGVTIAASGGIAPYSYAVTSGALPAGLSFDSATGAISGTPTASGAFNFTVTATDSSAGAGPYTVSSSYTLLVDAPIITVTPASLPNGRAGASYSQTLTATGGIGPYGFAVTAGALPPGWTLTSAGVLSGIATESAAFNFTVTATDQSTGATAPHSGSGVYSVNVVSPAFTLSAPTLGATAGIAYSGNFVAGGGTAPYTYSKLAGNLPPGLTLASDGTLSGTPTASGTFNFTLIVRDSTSGAGGPYSVGSAYRFTVNSGAFVFLPAPGALPGGTTGAAYSQTIAASGGTAPYRYAITNGTLPGGLSLDPDTGVISGTPFVGMNASFTITATDANNVIDLASYTLPVVLGLQAPIANPVSQTVAANSFANPVTLNLTGGAAASVAVDTEASHGTATASGATITYTPVPGYSGVDTFTYTATNATGTSSPAMVTVTVSAPTLALSPAAGPLTAGTIGTAYNVTFTASGGMPAYTYAVTGVLPAGLTLDPATGILSGTPTTAGIASFTITATDANSAVGLASYTIAVSQPQLVFSPAAGALPAGTVNTGYSQMVSASGGTAPYTYTVSAGALPAGLTLDPSTGAITGTPTTAGRYNVTVTATDAHAATASAPYSMTVNPSPSVSLTFSPSAGTLTKAMAGEAYSQQISVTGGTVPLLYSVISGSLPPGMVLNVSTGELTGPLDADTEGDYSFVIQVRDATNATGTASYTLRVDKRAVTVDDKTINVPAGSTPKNVNLTAGATGGPFSDADLTFVEPANAGTVSIVNGEFAQAGPSGPLGWYLKFIPNPAYSGTVRVGFRLTSVLGTSNTGVVTYMLAYDPAKVAEEIDGLVHGFVQTRQSLIASSINVPGLLERRRMENATDPVTTRMSPSGEGMTASFSTSLAQMEAARDAADGVSGGYASPFNVWIDGAFMLHNREQNDGRWGSFAMVNLGADYLVSEKALVGLSFHYDRMSDPTDADTELTGNGWMAGPYASFEIGKGVFWDASLRYGGSANDIDTAFWDGSFDTTRWMIDTAIKGEWKLDEATVLTPKLRVLYFSETVDDYTVKNAAGDALTIDGFDTEQFRVSLGAEISRSFTLENGSTLTPKLGVTGGFSGLDGSGAFASLAAGMSMQTANEWSLDAGLLFNIEGDGEKSVGVKGDVSRKF